MRVGIVLLPELDWQADRGRWQRAEAYGFDTAWIYDHLAWRTMADGPWHATVPTLVAAAVSTSRIRLGTLVASPNLRHPVPFAKDLMTLDVMSAGRLTVGIGAGGTGVDADVLGLPPLDARQRANRFAEFVELLDACLTQPATTWHGEYYRAVDARTIPGPAQRPRPPFVIAANGPRGMRLAQRHGGWVTNGIGNQGRSDERWWRGAEAARAAFDRSVGENRPLPAGFVTLLNVEAPAGAATSGHEIVEQLGRAASLGFTDAVFAWPRSSPPYRGEEAWLDVVAAHLPELAAAR